jgi:hypothetical protein
MVFSEKVRGTPLLRKNHPLNQQYQKIKPQIKPLTFGSAGTAYVTQN